MKLVLCVTTACNLSCCHCLRGDFGHYDMSSETAKKIADFSSHFNEIVITGGEPFLNLDACISFLDNCSGGSHVYTVTNGLIVDDKSHEFIRKAILHNRKSSMDDYLNAVEISRGSFHFAEGGFEKDDENHPFLIYKTVSFRSDGSEKPINVGRASENCLSKRDFKYKFFSVDEIEEFDLFDHYVIVKPDGSCCLCDSCDCDWKSIFNAPSYDIEILTKKLLEQFEKMV